MSDIKMHNSCRGSGGLSPTFRLCGMQFDVGLVVKKWHWDKLSSEDFCFSLSVSFRQCSIFVFHVFTMEAVKCLAMGSLI